MSVKGYLRFLKSKIIFILLMTLLLTGSFALTQNKKIEVVYKTKAKERFDVSDLPILKSTDNFPILSAQSVFAIDIESSVVLYEKNPDLKLYPASTTKMVTALVALDYYDLSDTLNTGQFSTIGQKMGLVWNEDISVENLLYGLLVHSANDAAEVFALNYPGGREAFVRDMNIKARQVHALNTQFKNPSGLDEEGHHSTARDLARIAMAAMNNDTIAGIVSTEERIATSTDGKIVHHLTNRNELLGKVEGVLGVKTGWTEGARENLVTYIDRNNRRIIISLVGSQDRFGETEELVEWIYSNYTWKEVNSDQPPPNSRYSTHQ